MANNAGSQPKRAVMLFLISVAAASAHAQQRQQVVANTPIIQRFEQHDDTLWWRTHDRAGGKATNDTGFSASNIDIRGGAMTLTLTDEPYRGRAHTGASYKSRDLYQYGRYDVVMKAARGSGVISAFYTYTGPVFGDPHDEIDFEFLGRNTREVHLNYFVDGKPQLKRAAPLGFDAAKGFHLYTFEWRRGEIIWRADGKELLRVQRPIQEIPQHPGKIIADIWAAKDLDKWAGPLDKSALPATAFVRCMSFRPFGADGPICADKPHIAEPNRGKSQ